MSFCLRQLSLVDEEFDVTGTGLTAADQFAAGLGDLERQQEGVEEQSAVPANIAEQSSTLPRRRKMHGRGAIGNITFIQS